MKREILYLFSSIAVIDDNTIAQALEINIGGK